MDCRYIGGRLVCGDVEPRPEMAHQETTTQPQVHSSLSLSLSLSLAGSSTTEHEGMEGTATVAGVKEPAVSIGKLGKALLEGKASTVKSLVTEEVKTAPQPSPAATPPSSKEITAPPSRPGRALLEGVALAVKELQEVASTGVQRQPAQGQVQEEFGGFEGVYRGGRLYRLPSGGVVEHGVTLPPTPPPAQGQEQGGATPPTTGTGGGKGGGGTPGSSVLINELQDLVVNKAKETLSNLDGYNAQNFVQIMNDLKYIDPKLYDQLMSNSTIKEAYEKASNYLLTHYGWNPEAFGGADVGDLISRLLGVSSGSQAISGAIRDIASGNWQAAHDKLSKLKALLDLCEVNKKACSMLDSWGYNKETINKLYNYIVC